MTTWLAVAALLLAVTLLLGLLRIIRGPTPADRILAAQLFGTTGTGILFLLAEVQGLPALQDVGIVFATLAAVTTLAFAQRLWPESGAGGGR